MNYSFDFVDFHLDDRAERCLDVFRDIEDGQINLSFVKSTEHIVAWHKHEKQTDYWFCVKGSFKVGLSDGEDTEFVYLTERSKQILTIPPGIYHGYKAIEPGSILMYYLTEKYNPKDEFRAKIGEFNEIWESEIK